MLRAMKTTRSKPAPQEFMHAVGRHEERSTDSRATYSVVEAARILGISRGSAYEAARRGQLPTIRIQRRVLVPKAQLDELLGRGQESVPSLPAIH